MMALLAREHMANGNGNVSIVTELLSSVNESNLSRRTAYRLLKEIEAYFEGNNEEGDGTKTERRTILMGYALLTIS
jgi:hypothetical protein